MLARTWALTTRELKHFYRSKMEIVILVTLPIIMLVLFGQAFNEIGSATGPANLSGAPDYISFMSIGILALTVMMTSMYGGVSIVMDHKAGFLKKLIVAPVNRVSISMSRILSSVIKSLILSIAMLGVALVFNMVPGLDGLTLKATFGIMDFIGILLVLLLTAWIFSSMIVMMSLSVDKVETMSGLINLFNLPFMLISAVLLPTMLMPGWLDALAHLNPLTWAADAMRQFAFNDPAPVYGLWVDLLLLAVAAAIMTAICAFASRRLLCKG